MIALRCKPYNWNYPTDAQFQAIPFPGGYLSQQLMKVTTLETIKDVILYAAIYKFEFWNR